MEASPDAAQLKQCVARRKPNLLMFDGDGIVPNNSSLPVILYLRVIAFKRPFSNAAVIDRLFHANGWGRSWRASVYDFVHYHSQVHEVLGVAKGRAKLELGGVKGKILNVASGDVVVLPAGTGHRLIEASRDFMVVGAYPPDGTYDECTDTRDRTTAVKRIVAVKKPKQDPVFGMDGPLTSIWTK